MLLPPDASIRLEYRYTDFSRDVAAYRTHEGDLRYNMGFEPAIHTVRLGFSYRFGQ